jgi:hypothetical protein
VKENDASGYG